MASDSTVPDNVTSFFVTSASTLRLAFRSCLSLLNVELTASSSSAFAELGLPAPCATPILDTAADEYSCAELRRNTKHKIAVPSIRLAARNFRTIKREILLTDESCTLAMQARERLPTLRQPPLRPYGSNEMLLPRRVLYPGLRLSASRFGNAHDFRGHRIAVNEFPSLPLQCGM